jgi:hypothetical protein
VVCVPRCHESVRGAPCPGQVRSLRYEERYTLLRTCTLFVRRRELPRDLDAAALAMLAPPSSTGSTAKLAREVQEGDEHGFVPVAYLREQLGGRSPAVLAKLAPAYTAHMPGVLQAGADENGNAGGKVFAVETVEIGAIVASK